MNWKGYGTTRKFLSTFVLFQIVCCALMFNPRAESASRMIGADGAILVEDLIASGFDTRMNIAFSDVYEPMNPADALGGASVAPQLTPDIVAKMFPAAPRANIEKYLPLVRKALAERGLVDKAMILMALATVRAESSAFSPISEAPSPLNTESPGPPFNKYDRRQDLGNMGPPDGARFKGRGFIQLTGRKNYRFYGALLGYNLVGNPEMANSPQPAAQILAAYLKENESSIRSALAMGDLAAARRIVNGGLNGLDRFRTAFLTGDLLIRGYESDIALSRESQERRESRKIKELKAVSTSTSKGAKSIAKNNDATDGKTRMKNRDDATDGKTRAKKRDDATDGKVRAKKKNDEPDEDKGAQVKKKSKGFFLLRPLRLLRTISRLP